MKQLLDGIPKDMPVLIDEAYHHFVDDPNYATSVPYVLEGRPVIIARTFSKIAALAGMRLGYAIATPEIIDEDAAVQHGQHQRAREARRRGVAQGHGVAGRREDARSIDVRKKTAAELERLRLSDDPVGDQLLHGPHRRAQMQPVIEEFQAKKVLVGRPFPPMTDAHARLDRHARRDGALHDRVQGDLPRRRAGLHRRV